MADIQSTLQSLINVTKVVPKDSAEHKAAVNRITALISDPETRMVFNRLIAARRAVNPPKPHTPEPRPVHSEPSPKQPANSDERYTRADRPARKPRVIGSMGTANERPNFPRADCWDRWMKGLDD